MPVNTACEALSLLACKKSSHLVARTAGSMPIDPTFEKQGLPKLKGAADRGLTHRVAKDMCLLPPQMIHQGQGILRHDRRPATYEKHVSEIKYSEPPPILTSPTHSVRWKIFPAFLPHHSFSRESYYDRKQLKCGIFLIESYMQLLSSTRSPVYDSESQREQSKQSYLQNQNAPRRSL